MLLRQAADGYQKTALRGLEYAAAFRMLPVVLHQATRDLLPGSIATKLHFWAQRHHEVRIGFAQRMQELVPITKEALLFGLQHEALQLNEAGALVVGPRRLPAYAVAPESEVAECGKKALFVGRWFADAGNPGTVLAAWDVTIA